MKLNNINLHSIGDTIQMVGAVYADRDTQLIMALFPDENSVHLSRPIAVLEMDHEEWKTFLRQTDLLETEVTARAADGTISKAILRKSQRQIEQQVSWNVYRRDNYSCRYCGRNDVPLTVDHLVRWEEGGPSTEANLVSSCRKCNRVRGDTSFADWLKHEYYLRVSKNLSALFRADNEALLGTLDAIPRLNYVRKR